MTLNSMLSMLSTRNRKPKSSVYDTIFISYEVSQIGLIIFRLITNEHQKSLTTLVIVDI